MVKANNGAKELMDLKLQDSAWTKHPFNRLPGRQLRVYRGCVIPGGPHVRPQPFGTNGKVLNPTAYRTPQMGIFHSLHVA